MLRKKGEQKEKGCYSTWNQQIDISGRCGEDTEKKILYNPQHGREEKTCLYFRMIISTQ